MSATAPAVDTHLGLVRVRTENGMEFAITAKAARELSKKLDQAAIALHRDTGALPHNSRDADVGRHGTDGRTA